MRKSSGRIILGLAVVAVAAFTSTSALAGTNCVCRSSDGRDVQVGKVACVKVGDRSYLAQCEMNLNVTTWSKLQDGCPVTQQTLLKQSTWRA